MSDQTLKGPSQAEIRKATNGKENETKSAIKKEKKEDGKMVCLTHTVESFKESEKPLNSTNYSKEAIAVKHVYQKAKEPMDIADDRQLQISLRQDLLEVDKTGELQETTDFHVDNNTEESFEFDRIPGKPKHTEHVDRPYKCDTCNAAFTRPSGLKIHYRIHTGEKPYKCRFCNVNFTHAGSLTTHLRKHTGERPYKCDSCEMTFSLTSTLKKHKRIHSGEKPYKCTMCDSAFAHGNTLKSHLRRHTGEKPFKCNYCDMAFTERGSMNTHIRTHTGEKPYKCDICGSAFAQTCSYKSHMRTHTGERPFKCHICDATFAKKNTLTNHMWTHSEEKRFKCDICSATFGQSSNLKNHVRTHTGEKPNICYICNAAFARASSLKSHLKIHERHITNAAYVNQYLAMIKEGVVESEEDLEGVPKDLDESNTTIDNNSRAMYVNPFLVNQIIKDDLIDSGDGIESGCLDLKVEKSETLMNENNLFKPAEKTPVKSDLNDMYKNPSFVNQRVEGSILNSNEGGENKSLDLKIKVSTSAISVGNFGDSSTDSDGEPDSNVMYVNPFLVTQLMKNHTKVKVERRRRIITPVNKEVKSLKPLVNRINSL